MDVILKSSRLSLTVLAFAGMTGLANAQTTSPTQSPGSQGVTSPTAPNAPASAGGTVSGTGGVSQGDLVNSPPATASGGASSGATGQSNVPGETGSSEQDNRGVPASPNTQGQD